MLNLRKHNRTKKFVSSPLTSYNMKRVRAILTKIKNHKLFLITLLLFVFLLIIALNLLLLKSAKSSVAQPQGQNTIKGRFPTNGLQPTPKEPITLIFTGDVIPARSVNSQMVQRNNFKYPFEETASFLQNADLTIINLEAPLVKNCPVTDTGMIFCGDPRFIEGLDYAGIDIASLANNHASNWGKEGIDQTVALLNQNNIATTGINNIVYKEVKGTKFSFIAFNGVSPFDSPYISKIEKSDIENKVKEAKSNSDFIIVLYHWGKEYSFLPVSDASIAPFNPVEIGRFTIDMGADLVVGNHPHVIQGYEIYKEKPIFYALGNFVFDQMWSSETRIGVLLKIDLLGNKITSFSFYPVRIDNYAQPKFIEGEEKEAVLENLNRINN